MRTGLFLCLLVLLPKRVGIRLVHWEEVLVAICMGQPCSREDVELISRMTFDLLREVSQSVHATCLRLNSQDFCIRRVVLNGSRLRALRLPLPRPLCRSGFFARPRTCPTELIHVLHHSNIVRVVAFRVG